jgi:diacylglycerol kinase family enzyme
VKATLIVNDGAGSGGVDLDPLAGALLEAGYTVAAHATESEDELDDLLDRLEAESDGEEQLVVAVGGDGSVAALARRLRGRDLALAIAPVGTANNIAAGLGIPDDPREALRRLDEPRETTFDLGRIEAPWGEHVFVEAVGLGFFADVLADYQPEKGKSVARAASTLGEVAPDYEPTRWTVTIDDEDASGVLVGLEILNTHATGPRLRLAPDADPCDGRLDVVRIHAPEDVTVVDYVSKLLQNGFDDLPNVDVRRAEHVRLEWGGKPIHADDEVRGEGHEDGEGELVITVLAGAVKLLLPRPAAESEEGS